MLEPFTTWGEKLLGVSIVYSIIAMIITFGFAAVGIHPPPLEPYFILDVYWKAYNLWSSISGKAVSGDVAALAFQLLESMGYIFAVVVSLLASVILNFIWIAVLVASLLPPPWNILSVPIFVGAFFANVSLLFYLLEKTRNLLSRFLPVPS